MSLPRSLESVKLRWMAFFRPATALRHKYAHYRDLLAEDRTAQEHLAELGDVLDGQEHVDPARMRWLCGQTADAVRAMTNHLQAMRPARFAELSTRLEHVEERIDALLPYREPSAEPPYFLNLSDAADHPTLCGGKAANLSLAGRVRGPHGPVPIPPGFVVTARATRLFLKHNNLHGPDGPLDRRFRQIQVSNPSRVAQLAAELQECIMAAEVPGEIASELRARAEDLLHIRKNLGDGTLAVRSSALGEDGKLVSFAGQYFSELHVDPANVVEAYRRVLAGKYCPRALAYRITRGLTDDDTTMAVLVLPMLDAAAAGVVYTRDPDLSDTDDSMGVYAVAALGRKLVDGEASPKRALLDPRAQVRECEPDFPLDTSTLHALGAHSKALESNLGGHQDVEYAVTRSGRLIILQTRPLPEERQKHPPPANGERRPPALADGLSPASGGLACGPVYHVRTGLDYPAIPEGAVVVSPTLPPSLSLFAPRMAAVIAQHGGRASHFAAVAREAGLPVVVGKADPPALAAGTVVTVDGFEGAVYEGCLSGLYTGMQRKRTVRKRPGRHQELAALTVKLNLTDPEGPGFTPAGCASLHDIVRFCHEKSVAEMFSLVGRQGRGMGKARKLRTELPFSLFVVDLGGGLRSSRKEKETPVQDVVCAPFLALWRGLADARVPWPKNMVHMDWEAFDQVSGGILTKDSKLLGSYMALTGDYLHLSLRFGYHFSIVDSLCGDLPEQNYAALRFQGGGAAMENRLLRLEFIRRVLTELEFETSLRGDTLDARFSRADAETTGNRLTALGYLLAITRLMDMRLTNEADVDHAVQDFLQQVQAFYAGTRT